jgi:sulfur carrier protein ThiS
MTTSALTKDPEVTLTVFGAGRRRSRVAGPEMTIADVLREHEVKPERHRLARNGVVAGADEIVRPGDELTLVPRIQAG